MRHEELRLKDAGPAGSCVLIHTAADPGFAIAPSDVVCNSQIDTFSGVGMSIRQKYKFRIRHHDGFSREGHCYKAFDGEVYTTSPENTATRWGEYWAR